MDNKHATPTDLAYLAGLIGGEGSIAMQKSLYKGRWQYAIQMKITNSDPNIIERIQSIYLSLDVNPFLRENKSSEKNPNWKDWFDVYLTKQAHIKVVLDAAMPYLVGKKARAIIMLRFINKEMDREDVFQGLRQLNRKGEPSETTREAPELAVAI